VAAAPFPPSFEVTILVVLFFTPLLVAVTLTVKLQVDNGARVELVKLMALRRRQR
jgi:hypothetical protein